MLETLHKSKEVALMLRSEEDNRFSIKYVELTDDIILTDDLIRILERGKEVKSSRQEPR